MKNKGFTLVELLAVLVVLAVIALISIPAISSVIRRQEKNTFKINVESMIKVAKTDWYNNEYVTGYYGYINNSLYYVDSSGNSFKVEMDGKLDGGSGFIIIESGDVFIYAIHDVDWCATFSLDSEEIEITDYNGVCRLYNENGEVVLPG